MGGVMPDHGHQLINGRYRLVEVLGRGGMGTVWHGHDEMLDREVAIKEITLSPDLDDDARAELSALALQEARATARLNHPRIITIYDVIDNDGIPIIVMELLDGRSLADILKEEVRLPYRRVAEIGTAALEALREAHAAGIVHRDLKPANILISDRRIVITDFGVAQRVGERADEPGDVTGTPAFMAPEQAENAAASPAADLWALGATLFNATEGRPPYEGPDYVTVLLTLLTQDPPAPVRAGPLAPVITELLRRDPERRPSAEQVAAQLAEVLDEQSADAKVKAPATGRPAIVPAVIEKPAAPSPPATTGPARPSEAVPVRKAERPLPEARPRLPKPRSHARTGALRPPPPTFKGGRVAAIAAVVVVGLTVLYIVTHSGSAGSSANAPSGIPSDPLGGMPSVPQPTPSRPPDDSPPAAGFNVTAFSPDGGTVAFGGDSGVVRMYDATTRKPRRFWKPSPDGEEIMALAFSPDGRTVAAALDSGAVDLWNVATRTKREFSKLDDVVGALGFSSDGHTVTAVGTAGHVGIWTVRTGKHASSTIPLSGGTLCLSMAVSPNGYDVACGHYNGNDNKSPDSGILIWNAKKNEQRTSWPEAEPADGVAFSPDGKTVAFPGADDNTLQLWDIASHRMTIELHTSPIASNGGLAFSPDGRTLAVPSFDPGRSEDTVEIWKLPGAMKATTIPRTDVPRTLALSRDGSTLVTADGNGGELWNVRSHKKLTSWAR
ncbi:MAG: hypothetical protein JWP48_7158 [Actinoallomurus sp.]|jgi:serine/threonine protein kinase/sugar lactone lactonase YvrE|nr:hypothetical protein [Actinoallomurus sp.]